MSSLAKSTEPSRFFRDKTQTSKIMPKGISTNRRVTDIVQCLRREGVDFVCRYYSRTTVQPQKRLTPAEAAAIVGEKMRIVAVYEDGPTNARYFSRERGRQDGVGAFGFAREIGQPNDSAIYFAVDYDAERDTTTGPITEYFEGVKDGLAFAAAGGAGYDIGVYGSGRVCARIKEETRLAKYSWLAESTGWSGSSRYATWNIKQSIASRTLCGLRGGVEGDYEDNETSGDFGAFPESDASLRGNGPDPQTPDRNASSDYVNRLTALARLQFDDFHEFDESDPPLRAQIRRYWEGIGFEFPGVSTPWSAVFVSWCMRKAGASPDDFRVSTAHSRFVFWAIQNQLNSQGLFRGRRLDDYRPALGDIIQNNRGGQRLTYDFARAHEAYESHSAIVVEVGSDGDGRFVRTVGGNESNTVGRKRIPLTSDGFVEQRDLNPYICIIQNLK